MTEIIISGTWIWLNILCIPTNITRLFLINWSVQVPCKEKRGYIRGGYPHLTQCCSNCCRSVNNQRKVMSIRSTKCFDGTCLSVCLYVRMSICLCVSLSVGLFVTGQSICTWSVSLFQYCWSPLRAAWSFYCNIQAQNSNLLEYSCYPVVSLRLFQVTGEDTTSTIALEHTRPGSVRLMTWAPARRSRLWNDPDVSRFVAVRLHLF